MSWYVVRTAPGAQMPQREYAVEDTHSRKGYRIVPSLNPNVSAVERALSQNGFTHYMPTEMKVIRDRRKTGTWITRRYALLPGYMFVYAPHDFRLLDETQGVLGKLGVDGVPLVMSVVDMMTMRTIEARKHAEADQKLAALNRGNIAKASAALKTAAKVLKHAKRQFSEGTRVDVLYGRAIGRQATIMGWEDDGRLKAIADGLETVGLISVAVDMVRKVA